LGLAPFARAKIRTAQKIRGGGDAGRIPSPTAVCAKEKSTARVVTAKAGSSPGVPHSALGPWAIRAITHDSFFRPISRGPRWTDRTIHRWRAFSAPPYLRWHAFQTKPPSKALVTSGRLAGTTRLQPLRARVRYAPYPQPPFPIRTIVTLAIVPLLLDQDMKEYSPSLRWKYDGWPIEQKPVMLFRRNTI